MRKLIALALFTLGTFAAPAHAQERQWSLDISDEDAFLVFGVPETDDVGASFWCKLTSGKVQVFTQTVAKNLKDGARRNMKVSVNGKAYIFKGKIAKDANGIHDTIEATVDIKNKLFKELLLADRFSVDANGHTATYPLADANLESLLKLCVKP